MEMPQQQLKARDERRWPLVIGIIAMAIGLYSLIRTIAVLALSSQWGDTERGYPRIVDYSPEFATFLRLVLITGALAALVLLVGAYRLTQRRPAAVRLLQFYAILELIRVGSSLTGYLVMFLSGGLRYGLDLAPTIIRVVLLSGLGCVLPAFLLIWLRSPRLSGTPPSVSGSDDSSPGRNRRPTSITVIGAVGILVGGLGTLEGAVICWGLLFGSYGGGAVVLVERVLGLALSATTVIAALAILSKGRLGRMLLLPLCGLSLLHAAIFGGIFSARTLFWAMGLGILVWVLRTEGAQKYLAGFARGRAGDGV